MASAMVFFTGSVSATNWNVDVSDFSFSPAALTIDVGDSVTFTLVSGSHNVNGDSTAFPNNPDYSLYSGAVGNSWGSYVWVCTTAGNYDYQCDPHYAMVGSIMANAPPSNVLTMTTSVCSSALEVRMTGPWWGWDPAGGPIAVDNGNGTYTFTFDPAPTADMEYLLVVDGVQENLINAPHPDLDGDTYGDLWGCSPITDYWSYANRLWVVGSGDISNTYATCGTCSDVYGCMDATADNFDAAANVMDYSVCTYAPSCNLDEVTVTLYDSYSDGGGQITVDGNVLTNAGASSSMVVCIDLLACTDIIYASTDSWSYENSWDVVDALGNVIASGNDASGNVGACAVLGCTDATATNYNAAATADDGSCVYPCLDNAVVYTAGSYASENSFTITDCDGNLLADMASGVTGYDGCIVLPAVYSVNLSDSYGDSWNGGSLSIDGVTYTLDGLNDDGSKNLHMNQKD